MISDCSHFFSFNLCRDKSPTRFISIHYSKSYPTKSLATFSIINQTLRLTYLTRMILNKKLFLLKNSIIIIRCCSLLGIFFSFLLIKAIQQFCSNNQHIFQFNHSLLIIPILLPGLMGLKYFYHIQKPKNTLIVIDYLIYQIVIATSFLLILLCRFDLATELIFIVICVPICIAISASLLFRMVKGKGPKL